MNPLTQTVSVLGITIALAGAVSAGDYYLVKDVQIAHQYYSRYDYDQLKPQLIQIVKTHNVTPQQLQAWSSMADIEIKKCGSIDIVNYNNDTFVDDLNTILEGGKCK